jgi:hypothetical protein
LKYLNLQLCIGPLHTLVLGGQTVEANSASQKFFFLNRQETHVSNNDHTAMSNVSVMEKHGANLRMHQFKGGDDMDISDQETDHGQLRLAKEHMTKHRRVGAASAKIQAWWKRSEPCPRPSTPIQDSSQPMEEASDTPKTGNVI